jgi:tRNA acetyltransferase TAN1
VVFISCKAPVDPLQLVTTHVSNVQKTGVTQTRQILRLVPVVATCVANLPEIQALCRKVFEPVFGDAAVKKFKVGLTTLSYEQHIQFVNPIVQN